MQQELVVQSSTERRTFSSVESLYALVNRYASDWETIRNVAADHSSLRQVERLAQRWMDLKVEIEEIRSAETDKAARMLHELRLRLEKDRLYFFDSAEGCFVRTRFLDNNLEGLYLLDLLVGGASHNSSARTTVEWQDARFSYNVLRQGLHVVDKASRAAAAEQLETFKHEVDKSIAIRDSTVQQMLLATSDAVQRLGVAQADSERALVEARKLTIDHGEAHNELLRNHDAALGDQLKQAEAKLAAFEASMKDTVKLSEASRYWRSKRWVHTGLAVLFGLAFITMLAWGVHYLPAAAERFLAGQSSALRAATTGDASTVGLRASDSTIPSSTLQSAETQRSAGELAATFDVLKHEMPQLSRALLFILLCSLGIWLMKILARLFFAHVKLSEIANEKRMMIMTFLALTKEGKVWGEERKLFLSAICLPTVALDGTDPEPGWPLSIALEGSGAKTTTTGNTGKKF